MNIKEYAHETHQSLRLEDWDVSNTPTKALNHLNHLALLTIHEGHNFFLKLEGSLG